MNEGLRISVSGIRGQVPEALDVQVVSRFASAFAAYLEEGCIELCRDFRFSSQMLAIAAESSVVAAGLDCKDYGQLPISFLQYQLSRNQCAGGLAVSAGHNPLPWNAVVLLNESGMYLEAIEGPEVFNIYEAGNFKKAAWNKLGEVKQAEFPFEQYLESLGKIVNIEAIQKASFVVVADPCNGVVSPFLDGIAQYFNLNLISINDEPDKPFPHPPEPSPENSSQTEAVVKASQANLGFLFNSDGSRISFVDEQGGSLSEELSVPLCLLSLGDRIQKVVSTAATSHLTAWAAKKIGAKLIRTRVGQSAVVHSMLAEGAEVGGEGSGSLAYLPFSPGYDALLELSLVLDLLAREQKPLSELVTPFPSLFRKKLRIDVPPIKTYGVMNKLETIYAQEKPDYTDGIRVEREHVWFIIRPSSTEFILRILIEGEDEEIVAQVEDEIKERTEL